MHHLAEELEGSGLAAFSEFFEDMEHVEQVLASPYSLPLQRHQRKAQSLFLVSDQRVRTFAHNRKKLTENVTIGLLRLVICYHQPVYYNLATLGSTRKHSDQILLCLLRLLSDQGKSQIETNVMPVFMVQLLHLRRYHQYHVRDIRIHHIDLVNVLGALGLWP